MKYIYEIVKFDDKIPARILMQDKPGWRCNTRPHWHKEMEFVYMIDGEMNTVTNGKKTTIRNGEVFFCNSKDIHVTSVPDSQAIYKYLVVQISYEDLMKYCGQEEACSFSIEDEETQSLLAEQFDRLLTILESNEREEEQRFSNIKKTQIILEIYYILLTRCKAEALRETNKITAATTYAKQLMAYINQHYTENLSLEVLAKEVGLSTQYLSKHFKSATDMGIVQYINLIRLEHANNDLLNGCVTVTEAALNNGFPSVKTYIETCKKVHGMTPTYLLKESRKE